MDSTVVGVSGRAEISWLPLPAPSLGFPGESFQVLVRFRRPLGNVPLLQIKATGRGIFPSLDETKLMKSHENA